MSNDISALRDHLFATLAGLRDTEKPMEIERAKAVCDVAQVVINTAKVEVEYARVTGQSGSSFLGISAQPQKPSLPPGITGVHQHRIK